MGQGWIRLHRQIQEHWIWKDPVKFHWWVDMLLTVNHADTKVNIGLELYECKRGQSILSLKSWGERWGVSKDAVRNFFVLLEKDKMISRENIQKTTRITICNYDSYQSDLHARTTDEQRTANGRQTDEHPNKNEKKIKKNDNNIESEKTAEEAAPTFKPEGFITLSKIDRYLFSDSEWVQLLCINNKINESMLFSFVCEFVNNMREGGKKGHKENDLKKYFSSWLRCQLTLIETGKKSYTDYRCKLK